MPLFENAGDLIRANLSQFNPKVKVRVKAVAIGALTYSQLSTINAQQATDKMPSIAAQVMFIGWHVYKSRILKDGYTIDDVIMQIASAICEDAVLVDEGGSMTAIQNPISREDRLGNTVNDVAVFRCEWGGKPRPELFSVVPKGDRIKPNETKGSTIRLTLPQDQVTRPVNTNVRLHQPL